MKRITTQRCARVSARQEPELPAYRTVNEHLVDLAELRESDRVLDLGAGSGSLTALLLSFTKAEVVAADPAEGAMTELHSRFEGLDVRRCRAEILSDVFPPRSFSCVLMANSIHLVTDLSRALDEISAILQPNGRFLFCTTHFVGAGSACEQPFYRSLVLNAKRIAANLAGSTKCESMLLRPSSRATRNLALYREGIHNSPLRYGGDSFVRVTLDHEFIRAVAGSLEFAIDALPEYPPEVATAALRRSCDAILSLGPPFTLDRLWYYSGGWR